MVAARSMVGGAQAHWTNGILIFFFFTLFERCWSGFGNIWLELELSAFDERLPIGTNLMRTIFDRLLCDYLCSIYSIVSWRLDDWSGRVSWTASMTNKQKSCRTSFRQQSVLEQKKNQWQMLSSRNPLFRPVPQPFIRSSPSLAFKINTSFHLFQTKKIHQISVRKSMRIPRIPSFWIWIISVSKSI